MCDYPSPWIQTQPLCYRGQMQYQWRTVNFLFKNFTSCDHCCNEELSATIKAHPERLYEKGFVYDNQKYG